MRNYLLSCLSLLFIIPLHAQFRTNGTAVSQGNSCFRLTSNLATQSGSVWYLNTVDISQSFDLYFEVNLGCSNGGADGMAFVLQPISSSVGSSGGGLGYQGISPSLAIEMDTYQNSGFGDPVFDHLALMSNGSNTHSSANNLAGPVAAIPGNGNLEDCQFHDLRILWDVTTLTLSVYLDCSLRMSYTGNIVQTIFNNNPNVYWGFTAATGALTNEHRFCLNYISFTQSLQDTAVCKGDTLNLDVGTGFSYAWTPSAGLSDTAVANPRAFPDTTTTYFVTVTDPCNNARRDSITITVSDSAALVFDLGPVDTIVCGNNTIPFDLTRSGVDYLWQNGSMAPSFTVSTAGQYWAELSNLCGAQRDTINVRFERIPSVDLGPDTLVCNAASLQVDVTFISLNLPATQYLWQDGSTLPSFILNQNDTLSVQLSNYCGIASDSLIVEFLQTPQPEIGLDTTLCAGDSITLDVSVANAMSYQWQAGPAQAQWRVSAVGQYIGEASNRCGTGRDTIRIDNLQPPAVDLGVDQLLCDRDSISFDLGGQGWQLLWQDGSQSEMRSFQDQGLYWVEARNRCGLDRDTVLIEEEQSPTLVLPVQDTAICRGEVLELDIFAPNIDQYLWSDGSNSSFFVASQEQLYWAEVSNVCGMARDSFQLWVDTLPAPILGPDTMLCEGEQLRFNVYQIRASYLWQDGSVLATNNTVQTGEYWVEVSNSCGMVRDELNLILDQKPPQLNLGPDRVLCTGDSLLLDARVPYSATAPTSYQWLDGSTDTTHWVTESGLYRVELINRCGRTAEVIEAQFELPIVPDLGADTLRCQTEQILLDASLEGVNTYRWQDGSVEAELIVEAEGIYWVTVENSCGQASDSIFIQDTDCNCTVFVPSAFSPNGDMTNDECCLAYDCEFLTFDMQIFNRWGRLIWQTDNPSDCWDGRFRGEDVPENVYVYMLTYESRQNKREAKQTLTGTITLIR